jgi:hypothetical protein
MRSRRLHWYIFIFLGSYPKKKERKRDVVRRQASPLHGVIFGSPPMDRLLTTMTQVRHAKSSALHECQELRVFG